MERPQKQLQLDLIYSKEVNLASDLTSIITQLEKQRAAIDNALAALREIGGATGAPAPAKRRGRPPGRKEVISDDAVNRRSEGQRRRWAAKKANQTSTSNKGGLTAAGRKRLSEMMKARWASKNPPKPGVKKKGRG